MDNSKPMLRFLDLADRQDFPKHRWSRARPSCSNFPVGRRRCIYSAGYLASYPLKTGRPKRLLLCHNHAKGFAEKHVLPFYHAIRNELPR